MLYFLFVFPLRFQIVDLWFLPVAYTFSGGNNNAAVVTNA